MSKARDLADILKASGKLANIEAGAEANQTDAEIKTSYEANADTNAFDDAEQTKLSNATNYTHPNHSGDVVSSADGDMTIQSGAVDIAMLSATGSASGTTFLRGDNSWQVVSSPLLDSPSITGTLSVDNGGTVSHTITNWSDDVTYVITPTNCTVGSVNTSGVFVVTHTSGSPSYTIKATTDSLGLDDSALVTKNLLMNLSAPTLSSPADVFTATDVVYTITSTDTGDDKIILDIGSSNFTFESVSVGSASKVGNTVVCTGFTTNNPAVTIQFTAEATYSVTAKSVNIAGTYGDSASSSADSITIVNFSATGGTTSTYTSGGTNYKIHTFIASGTFTVLGTATAMDVLIVGGGGGGSGYGGGGGAGGVLVAISKTISVGTHTVTIGGGSAGNGYNSTVTSAHNGANSSLGSFVALGGGAGSANTTTAPSGGSGGGGNGGYSSSAGASIQTAPSGFTAYGNNGGHGHSGNTSSHNYVGGGGGGAGSVGIMGTNTVRGDGGAGIANNFRTGSNVYYGGGGGAQGGRSSSEWSGQGGSGGGGGGGTENGCQGYCASQGGSGGVNTGGGGGANYNSSGAGGSGIIVVRYAV